MDSTKSGVIGRLNRLRPSSADDSANRSPRARQRVARLSAQRGACLDITRGRVLVEQGKHTLFVNAAITDIRHQPSQLPFVIDLDLPLAGHLDPLHAAQWLGQGNNV